MKQIITFGNPVYDLIEKPTVSANGRVLSGCSTNSSIVFAHLGHHPILVGRVGAADAPDLVARLQAYGVTPHIELSAETAGFHLVYDEHGNRSLSLLGDAGAITSFPDAWAQADAILIGPILHETPPALIQHIAQGTDAPLFLDPQGLLRQVTAAGLIEPISHPDIADMFALCHVVKASEDEAHILTGINPCQEPHAACAKLRSMGCSIAIITLAEAGSIIDDGTEQYLLPAFAVDACDLTGAGDTYIAGFVHAYLACPDDILKAGATATAVASIWIEQHGPDVIVAQTEVARRTEVVLQTYHAKRT
jgi:sugar/nucleoside kinase (ribokinase family)